MSRLLGSIEGRLDSLERRISRLESRDEISGASRRVSQPAIDIDARARMDALREERETSWRLIVLISVIVIVAALWLAERMA